jgi:phenylalanyl-tRNA synthetase beta chain
MQFPESWLRTFCDPPIGTAELAATLTMAGLEVEETRPVAPPFTGVVVARVLAAEPHPNADRLRVCTVDAGAGEPLQVVCGAPNVRAGMLAPLATVGASLPPSEAGGEPLAIGAGTIRGVESRGMLCSARELGLSEDHGGLLEIGDGPAPGADLRRALDLDDTVFTLKLTPNLGHDLSILGVARELSALTGAPLVQPAIEPVAPTTDARLPVRIEAPDLCGRFSGRVVTGIDPTRPTPAWMVERLARCGQRSVAALVDISNYVMFELGRPSHVFDLGTIEGGLVVRWARDGETLELLNGSTVTLDPSVGVIADAARPESLAGIMGGAATAVSDATRDVYVEAAFWWPEAVAGRSRRFGFATDAGHRFERGVDPSTTVLHLERLAALIVAICGTPATRVGAVDDHVAGLPARTPVRLRPARATRVVGVPLDTATCVDALARLGLAPRVVAGADGADAVEVVPPPWRFDLVREEDLIEEVVRIVGFERLEPAPPRGTIEARVPPSADRGAARLRRELASLGWQETIGYAFVAEGAERDLSGNADPIRVLNPITAERSVMRSTLVPSLVEVLRANAARQSTRLRAFEIGRVFRRDPAVADGDRAVAGVAQPLRVGGLAWGTDALPQWGAPARPVDFHDVKGDLESLLGPGRLACVAEAHPALHPGRAARVEIDGRPAGFLGELHPRWVQRLEIPVAAPVVFELDLHAVLALPPVAVAPLPRRQPAWRDVALVVPRGVAHAALMEAIRAGGAPLLRSATLFDVWEPKAPGAGLGEGERSFAVRLEWADEDAPLTDPRLDAAVAGVLARLERTLGVRIRQQQPAAA